MMLTLAILDLRSPFQLLDQSLIVKRRASVVRRLGNRLCQREI
jgi:hypothetical protein